MRVSSSKTFSVSLTILRAVCLHEKEIRGNIYGNSGLWMMFEAVWYNYPVSKQIWPRFGIHPALAYSMWAKHGPGLAEVGTGFKTAHKTWARCQM